ncbi:MAG: GtrA family protein [Pseudomonadota bacterium]
MASSENIDLTVPEGPAASAKRRTLLGQLVRYGLTGVLNTAVGYGIVVTCVYAWGFSIFAANVAGYAVGWTLAFYLNRSWTFNHSGDAARSAVAFVVLAGSAFLANVLITYGLVGGGVSYPVAQLVGAVTYSGLVFVGLRTVVFSDD